jgi:hypothetical protein
LRVAVKVSVVMTYESSSDDVSVPLPLPLTVLELLLLLSVVELFCAAMAAACRIKPSASKQPADAAYQGRGGALLV